MFFYMFLPPLSSRFFKKESSLKLFGLAFTIQLALLFRVDHRPHGRRALEDLLDPLAHAVHEFPIFGAEVLPNTQTKPYKT